MSEIKDICRQLYSIREKLTAALTEPPYTAGYVQQLIHLAIEIVEQSSLSTQIPAHVAENARLGLQKAQILADRHDTMNHHHTGLYDISDVLQPALGALDQFLVTCQNLLENE
ncbi:hypothetical protein GU926_05195 [Nibribacter ruber]|uniref:DUF86 domain-containing protein n=1 Tax=Nibribacter ruber TaxID=2698458 RepID=A0A6P1NX20_9BACT|nr:hypothetical protein [Nibribacter ruber]QHL86864.1 hypothetical protein GU926_05195 [Nibribacter ruber]